MNVKIGTVLGSNPYGLLKVTPLLKQGVGALSEYLEQVMINWERVNELRDEVGIEDFREVIAMFLEEVENAMVRMIAVPNPATLEEDMHFLKGSALNLGFAHFCSLCQLGETAAGNGQAETICLDDVFESYAASKTVFKERFGCMKAA